MLTKDQITKAQEYLIQNGIKPDKSATVLQTLGHILMKKELFPNQPIAKSNKTNHKYILISVCERNIQTNVFTTLEEAYNQMTDELYQTLEGFVPPHELDQIHSTSISQTKSYNGYGWNLQSNSAWSNTGINKNDWKII